MPKHILFLIILLPILAIGQTKQQDSLLSTIPNDATTIKVIGVTYKEFCLALLDSNYNFETRDTELSSFKTTLGDYKKDWNCSYSIEGRFRDSIGYLKFRLKDSPILFKYAKWQRNKKKYHEKSLYNYPFIEVISFCKRFTDKFEFLVEKLD
ncbi:MAG: hypothetical protein JNN00_14705 [Chitinophagaceae bacterium]|nr:hypothetical protein [Chitinophagaceae bacterium]